MSKSPHFLEWQGKTGLKLRWGPFASEQKAWQHLREHNPGRKLAAFKKAGYSVTQPGAQS